jgi:hypothetical protein
MTTRQKLTASIATIALALTLFVGASGNSGISKTQSKLTNPYSIACVIGNGSNGGCGG